MEFIQPLTFQTLSGRSVATSLFSLSEESQIGHIKVGENADAIVVGGYSPYGSVDGFTKAFLERLFSLRHQNGLNRGKFAVVVATGIGRGAPGLEETSKQIEQHCPSRHGLHIVEE